MAVACSVCRGASVALAGMPTKVIPTTCATPGGHRARGLPERHATDILCLQDCDRNDLPDEIAGLRLADATQGNRLGLAMYYRENTYGAGEVRALAVPGRDVGDVLVMRGDLLA